VSLGQVHELAGERACNERERTRAELLRLLDQGGDDLTSHQMRNAIGALRGEHTKHVLDLRASIYLPVVKRVYLVIAAGKERRSAARLHAEGQTRLAKVALLQTVVAVVLVSCAAFGAFCLAYLFKCLLGINLFLGQSPLHPLYRLLWVPGA
jgi:hypothetical protein